jgi:hypothetical protein
MNKDYYNLNFGNNSLLREIAIVVGHNCIYDGYIFDSNPSREREINLKFNDSQLPDGLDLPDLLICLAEEIRFQMNKTK